MVRLGHGARWRERTSKEQVEREVEDFGCPILRGVEGKSMKGG